MQFTLKYILIGISILIITFVIIRNFNKTTKYNKNKFSSNTDPELDSKLNVIKPILRSNSNYDYKSNSDYNYNSKSNSNYDYKSKSNSDYDYNSKSNFDYNSDYDSKSNSDSNFDSNSNYNYNYKSNSNSNSNSKPSQVNLITSLNRKKYIDNPTDYYTKKKNVTFKDDPVERMCENPQYNAEDDFLKKYVFNSQFYCEDEFKAAYKEDPKNRALYRDDFYGFRDKTQQLSTEYSPVDAINDMIVGNDTYDNMPINEIYDKLTANQYKSI
jgi:hypothetical protein